MKIMFKKFMRFYFKEDVLKREILKRNFIANFVVILVCFLNYD
jgi:hypothetical protein